ncbi:MAG: hypothetical protein IGBAC_2177 [Ignavibacteriae bacterium]|nr:MAG: hypothetical protein IGBAC_2177 [Ignavibacteriota bacterium]
MALQTQKILDTFGYVVSAIVILVGLAMIFGFLLTQTPENYRILFGIVLLLYGIYRSITIRIKQKKNFPNEE